MAIKIQHRRDTSSNWTSTNPTPHEGELCFETNTGKTKIGDGSTSWTSLAYMGVSLSTIQAEVDLNTAKVSYNSADSTKLGLIEALADVTDATNVTTAGALMDSEVTNLADVKAFDTTDYATAAQGTKVDGIEANATADQTGAEIKTAYELESDTNAYDDAAVSKLAAIEASATIDQTGAEIKTAYEGEANAFTDAQFTKLAAIESSATADQTAAQIKTAYEGEANAFTDAQFTKLAGVEALADVTDKVNVEAAIKTASGNYSYGIGNESLAVNTGDGNTASGEYTLKNTTSGNYNSAFGGNALQANVSGNENTASGYSSLASATGSNNTASGAYSLNGTNSGEYNVGIGYSAGSGITTGSNNTVIGTLVGTGTMASTVLIGAGSTERLKVDATGLKINNGSYAVLTDTNTTYSVQDGELSQINFTSADNTKLDGIEALADVTDTTNVVAALSAGTGVEISGAGVVSVSAVALTTVQTAADQTAQLALTAQEGDVVVRSDENKSYIHNGGSAGTMADYTVLATPTDAVLSVAGNTGAVTSAQIKAAYEGEADTNAYNDAAVSKLAGIEASATADQTGAEIKTAYELEADTNAYNDAAVTKLGAIEALADVTDTTNVVAALTAGTNVTISAGGTIASTDTNTTYSVADGQLSEINFTSADNTKLDAIEALADVTDKVNVNAAVMTASGNYNVAIGRHTLPSNTGDGNTASGYYAMRNNVTGSYNTAAGAYALKSTTSGSYNTASGYYSLRAAMSDNNTASGAYSLKDTSSGGYNIGIGYNAGNSITTGSDNTVIGSLGGSSAMASTVLIGAGATERLKVDSTGLKINNGAYAVLTDTVYNSTTIDASMSTAQSDITANYNDIVTNTAAIALNTAKVSYDSTVADAAMPKAGGTFSGNVYFGASIETKGIVESLSFISSSQTPNISNGTVFNVDAAATVTFPTAGNGKSFTVIVNTGTHVTWSGANIKWNGGAEPTKSAGTDIYTFMGLGSTWYGAQAGTGYA